VEGVFLFKKIKGLMPSLREKKRYLKIKIISLDNALHLRNIQSQVIEQINSFLGVFEASKAGILPVYAKKEEILIKVSTTHLNKTRAALLFINYLSSHKVILKSIRAFGSIKQAKGE
jgi:RNase P/RNase MRP subunit POP5